MEDHFSTSDISLAATIIATLGVQLIEVRTDEFGDLRFIFPKAGIPEEFIEAYNRGDLRVEPLVFSLVLSMLSERAEEEKNRP